MEICEELLYNKHKNNQIVSFKENKQALFGVIFCNVTYKGEM